MNNERNPCEHRGEIGPPRFTGPLKVVTSGQPAPRVPRPSRAAPTRTQAPITPPPAPVVARAQPDQVWHSPPAIRAPAEPWPRPPPPRLEQRALRSDGLSGINVTAMLVQFPNYMTSFPVPGPWQPLQWGAPGFGGYTGVSVIIAVDPSIVPTGALAAAGFTIMGLIACDSSLVQPYPAVSNGQS